jgi:hypothetical protein
MRMKRISLLFAATLNLLAMDAWVGTWGKVSSTLRLDPPPQLVITPRPNGLVLERRGDDASFKWSADFDGRDYPVSGNTEVADSVALRRVDRSTFEVTSKKAGKAVILSTFTISADGKELSASHTYPGRDGKHNYFFDRTGGSPSGANPFAGAWTMNYNKGLALSRYSLTFEPDDKDGVRCASSSSGAVWAGQFDGKEYPVTTKYRAWTSVALRRIDGHTFELTGTRAKTGPETWRIAVSTDNSQMTIDGQGSWSTGARLNMHEVLRKQ